MGPRMFPAVGSITGPHRCFCMLGGAGGGINKRRKMLRYKLERFISGILPGSRHSQSTVHTHTRCYNPPCDIASAVFHLPALHNEPSGGGVTKGS